MKVVINALLARKEIQINQAMNDGRNHCIWRVGTVI